MPSNAEIFLQLSQKASKEKRKKKVWRFFFFVFLLISFIASVYIGYVESFEPLLGRPAKIYEENQNLKAQNMDLVLSNQDLWAQIDSLQKINTSLIETRQATYGGIFFEIQIGAYKKLDLSEYEKELVDLQIDRSVDRLNQYTLGKFRNFDKALGFLKRIKSMGVEDAYLVAIKDGERIDLKAAKKEANEGSWQ